MAGVSAPLHWMLSPFFPRVAPLVAFAYLSPPSGFVTVRSTFADTAAKFAAVAEQCAEASVEKVVGVQLWVRDTAPCFLKNATGIVMSLLPLPALSVIRPKYCPLDSVGALMVIQMSVVWPFFSWIGPLFPVAESDTEIVAPGGAGVQ